MGSASGSSGSGVSLPTPVTKSAGRRNGLGLRVVDVGGVLCGVGLMFAV
jgi:hypothetical protein